MVKTQLKEKKESSNKKKSSGGIISQMIMNTPLMQKKANEQANLFGNHILQKQENKTGLPNNLKSGMESLSGMNLDSVKVHYNSSKPQTVQAHAFASGNDIHLSSGQEKHLPHELGHIVQQMQGRVKETTNIGGVAVNDNPRLENEATSMGNKALQMKTNNNKNLQTKIQLKNVLQATIKEATPTTNGLWEANMNGSMAGAPEVQNNKYQAGARTGSVPGSASPDGWLWLQGQTKIKGSWVRFHLINENIGGKGENANLVPTSQQVNLGSKWKKYETAVKKKYDDAAGYWIWSKTYVTPGGTGYPAGWPSQITGYTEWYDGSNWQTSADLTTTLNLSAPDITGNGTLLLDEVNTSTWKVVLGSTNYLNDKASLLSYLTTSANSSLEDIDSNLDSLSTHYTGSDDLYLEFTKNDWNNISYAVNQVHKYVKIQL